MSNDKMRAKLQNIRDLAANCPGHFWEETVSMIKDEAEAALTQQPESEPDGYTADNLAEEVCDRLETIIGRGIDGDGSPYSIAIDAVDFVVQAIKDSGLQFDDEDNTFRQPSAQVPLNFDNVLGSILSLIGTNTSSDDELLIRRAWDKARVAMLASGSPATTAQVPEWTDEQCIQFISVAMRHVEYSEGSSLTLDDIRLGVKFALKASPSIAESNQ